jgi:hypothetical protein
MIWSGVATKFPMKLAGVEIDKRLSSPLAFAQMTSMRFLEHPRVRHHQLDPPHFDWYGLMRARAREELKIRNLKEDRRLLLMHLERAREHGLRLTLYDTEFMVKVGTGRYASGLC